MSIKRLYEKVTESLATDILGGVYNIGDRLPSERDLATSFSVSRQTIREAMIALEVDGLIEVVTGSGNYIKALQRKDGVAAPMDVGPFELLEARAHVEGEAAAIAALHITDEQIAALEVLVAEMEAENARDVIMSEDADRRFHLAIAEATQNSAMIYLVEELWRARQRSQQSIKLLEHSRAEGVKPRIDEHAAIVEALRARNADAARHAMRTHLRGVADMVFEATEAEAIARTRAELEQQRIRFRL